MQDFKVFPEHQGLRADVFVARNYPDYSRSSLEKLFDRGMVTINNQPVKASYRIKPKQIITVDETKLRTQPAPLKLPVVHEDENLTVINKPEGILTHSKGALNEESTVADFIRQKVNDSNMSGNRAGIVHRLDRGTSGIIITAKNALTLKKLQKQFSQRRTKKVYIAIVEGIPEMAEAVIDAPIARNPRRPQTFKVDPGGKGAKTYYKVIKSFVRGGKDYSAVELKPETGRTHQIRVHLAYIGHPVHGDRIYGQESDHLYLHSSSLEITIPDSQRRVFEAPLPKYLKEFMK